MRKLYSILSLVLIYSSFALGQLAQIDIPITAVNGTNLQGMRVGLDQTATNGIDGHLGEGILPPPPPAGAFDARWDLTPYGTVAGTWKDYREAAAYPYSGVVQHKLQWQLATGATTFAVDYELPAAATMAVTDQFGGVLFNSGPLSGTGSYEIPAAFASSGAAFVTVTYTNIEPEIAGPVFSIAPASLNFGSVLFPGGSSMLQATVTNTGTAPLEISNIGSSLPEFTFTPNTFPINIAAGGNQVFDVTFTPSALGLFDGTLTFTHDAAGSPSEYSVQGTGADASPVFYVTPLSHNFGNVEVGLSPTFDFLVQNTGPQDALVISSAVTSDPVYSVLPADATIAAGGSQLFTVTFTPAGPVSYPATLTFNHNAAGSPSSVDLDGTGVDTKGLILEDEEAELLEDDDYTESIQLFALDQTVQALQFTIEVNMGEGDDQIMLFHNIVKGSNIADDPYWVLDYEMFRGPSTPDGMLRDYAMVLLYNMQNGAGLEPGDYEDLLQINFTARDLPTGVDFAFTTIQTKSIQASTETGLPVDITPSAGRDVTVVKVLNRTQSMWGDVNLDGYVDILDLILIVDHIVGRRLLTEDEFERADIAPWGPDYEPAGDGNVNVQDLALIQWIILNQMYPNGVELNKPLILAGGEDNTLNKGNSDEAKVIVHITNIGIAVRVLSDVGIRGAQLEFGSVQDNASSMNIDSRLGGGYYLQALEDLRVLLYDAAGNATITAGENFMANLPFAISDPKEITVDKVILVNIHNEKIGNIQIEISYEGAPEIPLDYALYQNFPNPFNPNTIVRFSVPQTSNVTITVYDMLGREVRTLVAGQVEMGTYRAYWDGLNNSGQQVSSGSYIYRMTAGEFVQSKKMMFLK